MSEHVLTRTPRGCSGDCTQGRHCDCAPMPSGEAALLRCIAAASDADADCSGFGDFSGLNELPQPLAPAEACTELGADTGSAPRTYGVHALGPLFTGHPTLMTCIVLTLLLALLGIASAGDMQAEIDLAAHVEQMQAEWVSEAGEVQP